MCQLSFLNGEKSMSFHENLEQLALTRHQSEIKHLCRIIIYTCMLVQKMFGLLKKNLDPYIYIFVNLSRAGANAVTRN